jgi:signal transduction histidine kinase
MGTQNEKGIGLGLILVKEFVETNKGSIAVQSHERKGTTFTVTMESQPA